MYIHSFLMTDLFFIPFILWDPNSTLVRSPTCGEYVLIPCRKGGDLSSLPCPVDYR